MPGSKKRQSPAAEPTAKRSKPDSDLFTLEDQHATEEAYQSIFQSLAHRLINGYELVINEHDSFRLTELEFYLYHATRHADTFAHRHPEQVNYGNWYFHRQGTSDTAAYKGGTYKGLDMTFGSANETSYGGILIRSLENKQTGQVYEGSCLVVDAILNLCTSTGIKELVEMKMHSNAHVFHVNPYLYLRSTSVVANDVLVGSPRVGLTLKVPSVDRERFLFRSYRFTPTNYYPSKMKMSLVLALAAQRYFQSSTTGDTFASFSDDLAVETKTRLATVKSNLADLQRGYDQDATGKVSPLVHFHKRAFSTSDLATAYGIWLRTYRSTPRDSALIDL